ncbi:TrgA family protein [Celeribacter halophilus]|uniref:TrgA family protein n=1 Tax=Celeribacter halophilus TaxID=576117 RepID=UPI003A8D2A2E
MPTAAKLVAAFWFALLAWFAAELTKNYVPEGTQFGIMSYIAAGFGFLTGWVFLGRRAGDTMAAAYSYGFSSSVILTFWSVFYFAFETMIHRSLDRRYRGPTEAVLGVFDLMRDYFLYVFKPDVLFILIIGGFFGGWITEKAARKWS